MIIIVALAFSDCKIYQHKKNLVLQVNAYQKKIDDLKKSSQTLKDEIANSDNTDYLEKLAYEQLGQQRPGERQVIFISPSQENPKEAPKPKNFWELWTGWLGQSWSWLKSKI